MESKDSPTKSDVPSTKCMKTSYAFIKHLFYNKCFLLTLSVTGIAIIWLIVPIPLIVRIVEVKTANLDAKGTGVSNQRQTNLTQRLPPLNLTKEVILNSTVQSILCINSFIYSPNDSFCFPSCEWDPFDANFATVKQVFYILINVAGLILGVCTLVGWVATSCVDWKKKRVKFDFQLSRTSLFVVMICSLILIIINLTVDLLNRDYLYCSSGSDGQQYLPAHLNQYTSTDDTVRITINLIGALFHYFSLCSLIWLTISYFNIFLIVFFPFTDRNKKKMFVFITECVIGFAMPLLPIILAVAFDSDSPYGVVYTLQQIYVFDAWLNTILHNWPYFLISGVIITLAILIVLKVRFNSIRSKQNLGKSIKLTDLEKRLLAHSLLLMFLLTLIGIQLLFVNSTAEDYHFLIEEYILCSTVNSPVEMVFIGSNTTFLAYRVNTIGGTGVCKRLLDSANNEYPSWAYMLLSVSFRIIWFIPFIVLIPCCSCRCHKKTPVSVISTKQQPPLQFRVITKANGESREELSPKGKDTDVLNPT